MLSDYYPTNLELTFSPQARQRIVGEITDIDAEIRDVRAKFVAHMPTVDLSRMPANLADMYRSIAGRITTLSKQGESLKDVFRSAARKAVAAGKIDPAKIPPGLSGLSALGLAIVAVVLGTMLVTTAIAFAIGVRDWKKGVETISKDYATYSTLYGNYQRQIQASGGTPLPPAPPPHGKDGGGSPVTNAAVAGVNLATLAVVGGIALLFMKGAKR